MSSFFIFDRFLLNQKNQVLRFASKIAIQNNCYPTAKSGLNSVILIFVAAISQRDCNLINGCWLDNACFYPYDSSNLRTKADFTQGQLALERLLSGQPSCLPFDNVTNGDFLDAYDACHRSGCAMDIDKDTLLRHLHGASTSYLPTYLQHQYWTMTLLGQVRADNWRQVADRLIGETANNNLLNRIIPQTQNQLNSGNLTQGGISFMPFALSFNSSSGSLLQSPFLSFGTFGEFASSNLMEANSLDSRQFAVGNRPQNSAGRFNLRNIASSANESPANRARPPWQNLQSLLSGLNAAAPNTREIPTDSGTDERNLDLSRLPCLYQPIQQPNLPPLTGNFEGCCDRPLCFIPRIELRNAKSQIASYTTYWTTWGPCSATCGSGTQIRRRFCVGNYCGENVEEVETQSCSSTLCPTESYSTWSDYSDCSATCGNGFQTRTRQCLQPPCNEQTSERKRCQTVRCAPVRYGSWSRCSTTCGEGIQRRSVICTANDRSQCPKANFEQRVCHETCGQVQNNFRCDSMSCYTIRARECLQSSGEPGYCGPRFRPSHTRTQRKCYEGRCCDVHRPRNRQICYRSS